MKIFIKSIFILMLICTVFASSLSVLAEGAPVSPALSIIAEDTVMAKTCIVDNKISFSANDFEEALGIKKVSKIKITSLPPVTSGKLMLGALEVVKDQTISRRNLRYLRFEPCGNEVLETSFTFTANGNTSYEVECSLYVISELNFAPTSSIVNDSYLNVSTQKNISYYGTLKALDPENDDLVYKIVKQPKNGLLALKDKKSVL
ncbi:MAG: hypothetical protein E7623_06695, partial [Ruminococcaceae bacterium]|nr:hypothetical protein [Oscillospiraceae bacterium]